MFSIFKKQYKLPSGTPTRPSNKCVYNVSKYIPNTNILLYQEGLYLLLERIKELNNVNNVKEQIQHYINTTFHNKSNEIKNEIFDRILNYYYEKKGRTVPSNNSRQNSRQNFINTNNIYLINFIAKIKNIFTYIYNKKGITNYSTNLNLIENVIRSATINIVVPLINNLRNNPLPNDSRYKLIVKADDEFEKKITTEYNTTIFTNGLNVVKSILFKNLIYRYICIYVESQILNEFIHSEFSIGKKLTRGVAHFGIRVLPKNNISTKRLSLRNPELDNSDISILEYIFDNTNNNETTTTGGKKLKSTKRKVKKSTSKK
jgi:hypothetical protein